VAALLSLFLSIVLRKTQQKYGNLIAFCNRILLNHFRMAPREVVSLLLLSIYRSIDRSVCRFSSLTRENPTQAREASKTAGPPKSELLSAGVFLGVVGVLMGATYYFSSSDKQ
jgi:YHS domain-containing protein